MPPNARPRSLLTLSTLVVRSAAAKFGFTGRLIREPHQDHSRERRCSSPSPQVGAVPGRSSVDGARCMQRRDGELRGTGDRWPSVSSF